MQGLHLTADLFQCGCDRSFLTRATHLADFCRERTREAGLTLVDEKWHAFPENGNGPGGVTGVLLLAESHLAVHTWPERRGVTLDVYVCNYTADNTRKAEQLIHALEQAFKAENALRHRLHRGDLKAPEGAHELLLESINPYSVYGFRFSHRLLSRQTKFQHLELFESPELGPTLRLDGHFMTSAADEFFYHEALVHPAAIAHPHPREALIIGGGDGGVAEELLKHPSIEEVTLVELDEEVIAVSREHLRSVHHGALDDRRVRVLIQDGAAYVAAATEKFDLVFFDLTDPETPAGPLYTRQFLERCKEVVAPGGALVLHLGAPFYEPGQVRAVAADLFAVFEQVHAYGLHIPLYGAYWALAVASTSMNPAGVRPAEVAQRLNDRRINDLRYYNAQVHPALFALPGFYRDLMPQ